MHPAIVQPQHGSTTWRTVIELEFQMLSNRLIHLTAWTVAMLLGGAQPCAVAQSASVRGAGATFPYPIYAEWAAQYHQETGGVVSFEPVGSSLGVEQIARRLVDFGASDTPLGPDELRRLDVLQFPAVIGGVVPVVNVPGIKPGALRLTGAVLANIYRGTVRKWSDQAIAGLNPALNLPDSNITVVHRSDSSGTTFLWSEFLSRSSPPWKSQPGTGNVLAWPAGVGAKGNEGMASLVQRTRLSIGYVEYAYAKRHGLTHANVRNQAGEFVSPGKDSFAAAAAAVSWHAASDLDQTLVDAPGEGSWPIAGASFILIGMSEADVKGSREAIRFFDWAFRQGGPAAARLDYAPLPAPAAALVVQLWADRFSHSGVRRER